MTNIDATSGELIPADRSSTQVIDSMHIDYIHQVAFDVYGRRIATCSGDRCVRVWDLNDQGGWSLVAKWQAHRGAVEAICWAHPEFGSLLATCGSDHDAKIWEERSNFGSASKSNNGTVHSLASQWITKASLPEARRAVTCLEFAPRHWGLKLAVGSADGCVRIYEAVDIMNLSQWPLAATIQAFASDEGSKLGCTSLSWCNGRFEAPTLCVGGNNVIVYRYAEAPARAWEAVLQLPVPKRGHILHVAWAPNVGRRFHYIASAQDQELHIYQLRREMSQEGSSSGNSGHLTLESTQTIQTSAWRCQWNVTGTVLAASGDQGRVELYKADFDGNFSQVARVPADSSNYSPTAMPTEAGL